ncbi:hypothetical protein DFH94DRAFT_685906 [Russula ochroleuca]|uniref:Uncharacterized protein n=1 Tax=Russula ochroleuca TaxID=152965 RepID=A0A9P5JVW6_9AGAM|nr:hypothetical protein DFH94DRAFT_685906 [Russula ochroleuca]
MGMWRSTTIFVICITWPLRWTILRVSSDRRESRLVAVRKLELEHAQQIALVQFSQLGQRTRRTAIPEENKRHAVGMKAPLSTQRRLADGDSDTLDTGTNFTLSTSPSTPRLGKTMAKNVNHYIVRSVEERTVAGRHGIAVSSSSAMWEGISAA